MTARVVRAFSWLLLSVGMTLYVVPPLFVDVPTDDRLSMLGLAVIGLSNLTINPKEDQ